MNNNKRPSMLWNEAQRNYIGRKIELLRGSILKHRGAKVGRRFGLGRAVQIHYPSCLTAGNDVTISEFSYLHCLSSRGVVIGNNTSFDRNLWLHCGDKLDDHGYFEIGENSYIGCNCVLGAGGGISIGNDVLIGQSVNFHAEKHIFIDVNKKIRDQGVNYHPIEIEDDVWIGSQVVILAGVRIGQGSIIGAGSVVTRDIPAFSVAYGVPAMIVRSRGGQKTKL